MTTGRVLVLNKCAATRRRQAHAPDQSTDFITAKHIKLDTILEKDMAGVVLVALDPDITEMMVNYAIIKEENPKLTDYIVITLPEVEYTNYAKMRTKKHLKNGIERFLQSSLILPVITEAIGKLRMEEFMIENFEREITKFCIKAPYGLTQY